MAVTVDQAELLGAVFETLFYGIYLVMFPVNLYLLLAKSAHTSRRARVNPILVVGTIILFLLVTSHLVIDQLRIWAAFITNQHIKDGPLLFFARLADPRDIARTIVFSLEILTLDALLLYRVFVIWNRNSWIVVLPALSLCGSCVTGVGVPLVASQAPVGTLFPNMTMSSWITAGFALSLSTNAMSVAFIAYRIIRRDREVRDTSVTKLSSTVVIVAESAGLYCINNVATMVALIVHSPLELTFLSITSPMIGISFSLMTLRARLASTLKHHSDEHTRGTLNNSDGSIGLRVRVTHEPPVVVRDDACGSFNEAELRKIEDTGDSPATEYMAV